jgi:hypothetical protein
LIGVDGQPLTVEVHVSSGLPAYTVVGLPDAAVRESRERVRAATLSSGLPFPMSRITVNLGNPYQGAVCSPRVLSSDVHLRAHAHVEDHIRRLKASGLERFPFTDLDANRAWMALVCFAADLVRWFQLLCLRGPLAKAEPKTLRWQLWHTPARVVRHARQTIVRILDDWPTADALLAAYHRIPRVA